MIDLDHRGIDKSIVDGYLSARDDDRRCDQVDAREALEREYFAKLHAEARGNVSEMSRRCGLSRPMVREYLQRKQVTDGTRASDMAQLRWLEGDER